MNSLTTSKLALIKQLLSSIEKKEHKEVLSVLQDITSYYLESKYIIFDQILRSKVEDELLMSDQILWNEMASSDQYLYYYHSQLSSFPGYRDLLDNDLYFSYKERFKHEFAVFETLNEKQEEKYLTIHPDFAYKKYLLDQMMIQITEFNMISILEE